MIQIQSGPRNRVVFISALLALTALVVAACGETEPATDDTALATASPPTAGTADRSGSGIYTVGSGSEATFTVNEKLSRLPLPSDAVLRTGDISGEIDLSGGTASLVINLHALRSDSTRRDGYVRDRMFPGQPEATISIGEFPEIPDSFANGESFTSTVIATVNVNGTDADVEFDIEARLDPDRLFVLVTGDFVWADFGMTAPVSGLFVVTDEVHVEVLVAATPS